MPPDSSLFPSYSAFWRWASFSSSRIGRTRHAACPAFPCDETLIEDDSTRTVSGFIAELKYVIHGLTRRHRINYKAWMKAGKPNLGWKPVA
ncbi:hypothetical protein [Bifidobacterium longum]|uniref:hypothetical protein n=1 Tax=Bifidobacterium longum TaxID=216816 RepID=UPI002013A942|nr:hypothetical protein [Bifidobacterium longum]